MFFYLKSLSKQTFFQLKAQPQAIQRERIVVSLFLFFLGTIYILLALILGDYWPLSTANSFGAIWSPDSGARFAMICSWLQYGHLAHLHYASASLDPTGQIHPLAYFIFHQPHGFTVMYPVLFPFVCGLAYRAFGFIGLTFVPTLCGLGCALTTYKMGQCLNLKSRLLLLFTLGLATPLMLYSVVFWDHTAIMLLTSLTGYWMLKATRNDSLLPAIITGTLIGAGLWIHELFLALFVATWLAALPLIKSHPYIVGGLILGFFPAVIVWGVFNWSIYHSFGGPHLGANVLQNNSDHPFNLGIILDYPQFFERAMAQLVGATIFDAPSDLWPYYFLLAWLLIVYTFTARGKGLIRTVSLGLVLMATGIATFLVVHIHTYAAPQGLFEATPLLIPSLAVSWSNPGGDVASTESTFYAWLSRTCWLFLLFLLINPMYPGVDWGSRYLLAALPLIVLLAAKALEQQYEDLAGRRRNLVLVCSAGLIAASFICQVYGLIWVRRCLAYGRELNTAVNAITAPILVTNTDLGARLSYPIESQRLFLVRTNSDEVLLGKILMQRKVSKLTFVGTGFDDSMVENAILDTHQLYTKENLHSLFKVNASKQQGDELESEQFIIKPKGK